VILALRQQVKPDCHFPFFRLAGFTTSAGG
jgi:hypothetical protein